MISGYFQTLGSGLFVLRAYPDDQIIVELDRKFLLPLALGTGDSRPISEPASWQFQTIPLLTCLFFSCSQLFFPAFLVDPACFYFQLILDASPVGLRHQLLLVETTKALHVNSK